jgi:excisionase family DNA binding protein
MSLMNEFERIPPAAITVNEFCKAVSIKRTTFYKLVGAGEIEILKLGGKTLIRSSEIGRLLDGLTKKEIK